MAVDVECRSHVAVPEAGMEPYVPRVTMTYPTINAARRKVFLAAGADKRATLEELARVLKPGGELHVADFTRPSDPLMALTFAVWRPFDGLERTADHESQSEIPAMASRFKKPG